MSCTCQEFSHKQKLVLHYVLETQIRSHHVSAAWNLLASSLRCQACSEVPRATKELIIVFMATLFKSEFVWAVHQRMINDEKLHVFFGETTTSHEDDWLILQYTQALLQHEAAVDQLRDRLIKLRGVVYFTELTLTISFYANVLLFVRGLNLRPKSQSLVSHL